MRVNVYAEEMTDRIEIIAKKIDGHNFTVSWIRQTHEP